MLASLIITLAGAALLVAAAFTHSLFSGLLTLGAVLIAAGFLAPLRAKPERKEGE
jgi:hypothetical protein